MTPSDWTEETAWNGSLYWQLDLQNATLFVWRTDKQGYECWYVGAEMLGDYMSARPLDIADDAPLDDALLAAWKAWEAYAWKEW